MHAHPVSVLSSGTVLNHSLISFEPLSGTVCPVSTRVFLPRCLFTGTLVLDFVIRGGAARRGGGSMNRPLPRGSSSRPMVARLVRYGPVRQKKTDFHLWKPNCFAIYEYRPDEGRRSL